jgi:hypothetical protein
MAKLPQQLTLPQMMTKWAAAINPFINNPSLLTSILSNIALTTGNNVIPHKLGRNLQGYRIVRQRAPASIYDTQDTNQMPALTLQLVSSAPVVIDLEVF